jgi:ABC-2 type transport system permease protein
MQRRAPEYWVISLGLAVTITVVYGYLVADPAKPRLGLAIEAGSPALEAAVADMERIEEIEVHRGAAESELAELRDGERWAVLLVPRGAAEAGGQVEVVYGDRSVFESTTGRGILREFLARLNRSTAAESDQTELIERSVDARKTLRLLDVLFPGIVGMTLMFGNSWAAGNIVWWRQLGILKRIGASPLNPLVLEFSQLVAFLVLSVLQVALLVALARLLFDVEVAGSYLDLAVLSALGTAAFFGVWYAFAAFMPSTTSFFSFLNLASFLMTFLGGSAFPIDEVPGWLKPLVQALPLTHLNEALRGVINRGDNLSDLLPELLVLLAWFAGGLLVSARIFRWGRE